MPILDRYLGYTILQYTLITMHGGFTLKIRTISLKVMTEA